MERLTDVNTNKVCYDSWELCELDHACKRDCREPTPCKIPRIILKLATLEDILYAPDGTERISLARLRELVQADAEGRAVVLPCKVGDTVYTIAYDCAKGLQYNPFNEYGASNAEICLKCDEYPCNLHKAVRERTIYEFQISDVGINYVWSIQRYGFPASDFGKTVFLTREAAETVLTKEGEAKE